MFNTVEWYLWQDNADIFVLRFCKSTLCLPL